MRLYPPPGVVAECIAEEVNRRMPWRHGSASWADDWEDIWGTWTAEPWSEDTRGWGSAWDAGWWSEDSKGWGSGWDAGWWSADSRGWGSDWSRRAGSWEDGLDSGWSSRAQVPEPKQAPKKKEGPDGYYTHGYTEEEAVGRRQRPIKGKWVPEEEVLIGFVPFSIARDLPEKGGEHGDVWQEICNEMRDLSCTLRVSSKSKNAKRAKKGFQPRSHSKVVIIGESCKEAWNVLLEYINRYKPGGFPPEWRGYPKPRMSLTSNEDRQEDKKAEVGHGCFFRESRLG